MEFDVLEALLGLEERGDEGRAGKLSLVPEGDLGVTFESLGTDTGRELQVSFCFYFSRE